MRITAVVFSGLVLLTQAQTPPASSGGGARVAGRVLDSITDQPIKGAIVRLESRSSNRKDGFLTGADGTFVLRDVAAGAYTLTSSKRGYFTGSFGSRRSAGSAISFALADREHLEDATVYMCPVSSIAGRVTDNTSAPIARADLEVYRQWNHGGLPQWDRVYTYGGSTADDGTYQIDNMAAGEYRVAVPFSYFSGASARVQIPDPRTILDASGRWSLQLGTLVRPPGPATDGARRLYFTTFYPSAIDYRAAETIRIAPGEHRAGVDVTLEPRAGHRVSGTVTTPEGPVEKTFLRLFPGEWTPDAIGGGIGARAQPDGEFAFLQVPPGAYTLVARRNLGSDVYQQDPLGVFATVPVVVGDADVTNLPVSMRPGFTVRGRMVLAGSSLPPKRDAFDAGLEPTLGGSYVDGGSVTGVPDGVFAMTADGEFVITGVQPGEFFARAYGPANWTLESAMLGGRDVSIAPFDIAGDISGLLITMTNRPSVISGAVKDGRGLPARGTLVLIFPREQALWALGGRQSRVVRVLRPDAGVYTAKELPAGQYYVAAVPDSVVDTYPSRDLLASLATTSALYTLTPSQQVVVNLTLGSRR